MRGVRFPGVQRPPLPRQAADQTEQGGHQAAPEKARGRDARPARIERDGGHRQAQPDHQGVGGLLPGCGVVQGVPHAGLSHVETHLQMGHMAATTTSRSGGSSTTTSASSTSSGTTAGCSATRDSGAYLVKFSWTDIVRHVMVTGRGLTRRPRPGRLLGRTAAGRSSPRWTSTPCACSPGRTRAVRSAGTTCSPPNSHPSPRTTGNDGGCRSPARR